MRWFGWLREPPDPDYSWPNPPRPLAPGERLCTDGYTMYNTFRSCVFSSGCGRVCVRRYGGTNALFVSLHKRCGLPWHRDPEFRLRAADGLKRQRIGRFV